MKEDIKYEIKISENVQAEQEKENLIVKGPKGEVKRKLFHPSIKLTIKNNNIILECKKATKREKALLNTFKAHVKNMLKGVQKPFVYKLKICSGPPQSHFPAQVSLKDSILSIKNFLGEKIPRELKIREDVKVNIQGNDITVESPNIESAGRTASEIESLTKIKRRDRRIFQDGIWIVEKP